MVFESNRTIVLYGIGSEYVYEAVEIALRAGVTVAAFVDNLPASDGRQFPGLEPVLVAQACDEGVRALPVLELARAAWITSAGASILRSSRLAGSSTIRDRTP